ncbi:MAG TPA: ribulose-phosphate 3-epimerase [Candidatus Nanoarchaeia archaeon]|nr:ribulose-phosphate 3-epimerase [uncultured archaeon]
MSVEILPAILSKTSSDYHRKLKAIEPHASWVQIDIVDNVYARNQTIDAKVVASIRTRLKLEIHLMVEHIENWLDPFLAIRPARIVFPLEASYEPIQLVRHMKAHQMPFGFSIEPKTSAESLQHLVDKIDIALLLAVHPGFSGQHFAFGVLEKIRKLRAMRPDLLIEVDGGIEPDTAAKCAAVGANVLAAGSFIFDNDKMDGATYNEKVRNAYSTLKEAVADVIPEEGA